MPIDAVMVLVGTLLWALAGAFILLRKLPRSRTTLTLASGATLTMTGGAQHFAPGDRIYITGVGPWERHNTVV